MTTNIIELLHTTAAYQAAAMQLMVNEANFAAAQMGLRETVPVVAVANTNEWQVDPPPLGIGGTVTSSNYTFWFNKGELRSINKYEWLKKITPPVNQFWELSERPSLLDTNTAYQLASQWLASISVDVEEMEQKYPPRIFQVPARKTDSEGRALPGISSRVLQPLFMIGWGEDSLSISLREQFGTNPPPSRPDRPSRPFRDLPPNSRCPVFVEIMGTTKELIELSIKDSTLLKRPALRLTNTTELLGPLPPPRHFVEELIGGRKAYDVVAKPDKPEAWLLTSLSSGTSEEKKDRAGPAKLTQEVARKFSDELLSFDSYIWQGSKMCIADYGARLRFTRGTDSVEVRLCYECDILEVTYKGKTQVANFDPVHGRLVNAMQSVFPNDQTIRLLR